MELKDLVGLGTLDAVDFDRISVPEFEGADTLHEVNVCRFRLNGQVYEVMEDPSDGYRSSMRDIRPVRAKMKNTFDKTKVFAIHEDSSGFDACDILRVYDVVTAKLVLSLGTDKSDDYYPSYVANFRPENMAANATLTPTTGGDHG